MSEIINARSPFYIKKISNPSEQANNEDLFLVKFDIYIYSGLVSNYTPGSPTYQINKYVKNETDNFVLIEVSELIRPDMYGKTSLLIEYGWSHPEATNLAGEVSDNPFAHLINAFRNREKFKIKNSSFSFFSIILEEINLTLSKYIRGQISVCLCLSIFYSLILNFLSLEFGFILGLFIGLISFEFNGKRTPVIGSCFMVLTNLFEKIKTCSNWPFS